MQIKFNNVFFTYNLKTPFQTEALKHINVNLDTNKIIAVVGKTGSGKSTLIQMINNLLEPTIGEVIIENYTNAKKRHHRYKEILNLRKNIGFLFQFSENQLFEDTVFKDVSFAIRNFYPEEKNYDHYVKESLDLVGINENLYNRSPLDLSGGEKKRVAIASVIAYRPKVLILDEPTAGLDAKGKQDIMDLFRTIHKQGIAIILVTHDMDIVFNYADEMIVMDEGEIKAIGAPKDILKKDVSQYNLDVPSIYKFALELNTRGYHIDLNRIHDIDSLVMEIKRHE